MKNGVKILQDNTVIVKEYRQKKATCVEQKFGRMVTCRATITCIVGILSSTHIESETITKNGLVEHVLFTVIQNCRT